MNEQVKVVYHVSLDLFLVVVHVSTENKEIASEWHFPVPEHT